MGEAAEDVYNASERTNHELQLAFDNVIEACEHKSLRCGFFRNADGFWQCRACDYTFEV